MKKRLTPFEDVRSTLDPDVVRRADEVFFLEYVEYLLGEMELILDRIRHLNRRLTSEG